MNTVNKLKWMDNFSNTYLQPTYFDYDPYILILHISNVSYTSS